MTADRIEDTVLIDAPVDVVWRALSDPAQLARWFCDDAQIELRPGAEGRIVFTDHATTRQVAVPLRIERVEAGRSISYRWDYPAGDEPTPGNSTLVEFTVTPEAGGTRVRVTESGLDLRGWTDEEKRAFIDDHVDGWSIHIRSLTGYALAQVAAGRR